VIDLADILTDLRAESADLDRLVAPLPAASWQRETPATGWTIAHQIAHLSWTDQVAIRSATDPAGFAEVAEIAMNNPTGFIDEGTEQLLAEPAELLARWREGRARLAEALVATPAEHRLPWFLTSMTPVSMATARLMETWAHGEDVAAALGEFRLPTTRLRHVVHLGTRTLGHSFQVHGRPAPDQPVYLELTGPDGASWAYGPPNAANKVTGSAVDFCLLVTQRRHRADLDLTAVGPIADEWLDVAQAFAGPPGPGRPAQEAA
jgi:uncharacterized protein (TIGR03084 family)